MKIRHVINTLDTGGAERLVVDLASALRRRGHDTGIVSLGDSRPSSPPWVEATDRELVTSLGLALRDPRIPARLADATRGCDVVHVHLFPALYWSALTRRGGEARVFTEHSTHNRRRGRGALRYVERLAYARQDRIVAISDGVGRVTTEYLAGLRVRTTVDVIRNGIDLGRYPAADLVQTRRETEVRGRLRLLVIGTLDPRKDPLRAVRLVSGLDGVDLTFVGDGPLRADVEQLVTQRGLEDSVRLLGTRPDIPDLCAQADALLVTSRHEGFGLAAAEALASGLPIVAPRLDGLGETVGTGGLLHAPDDDEAARAHLQHLRDDLDLRHRLSRAAARQAGEFDISRTAEAHETLYASLAAGRA